MPTGRLAGRYPLRITIVVVLLTLVTGALVVSGLTATAILRGYLVDRVDAELTETAVQLANRPFVRPDRAGQRGNRPLPSPFLVRYYDRTGRVVGDVDRGQYSNDDPLPRLPALTAAEVRALDGPFDVEAASGGATWRVLAVPTRNGAGTVMISQSLADMDETIQRLVGVQVVVGVILLVLLAGLGTYVVRRSLQGLVDVERTAVAIAAGELGRRVPQRDPRTEVGRLSLALNQMLGQIENAFAQRTASEFAARRSEETARRSEDAARRSEEAARRSEDRMRRFVADASHELRTPLTSIRGFAELSRQRGGPADPATMRRIEEEARRMGLLVDDLLLLARLDQQRPLTREPVDLLTLASDAVHTARVVQPGRDITLRILPDSDAPVVAGDEARLRQVLGNLVGNALHHTPVGTPITVSVGTRPTRTPTDPAGRTPPDDPSGRTPPDGRAGGTPAGDRRAGSPIGRRVEAIVQVADRGPGLTTEQKARVFERFYRTDSARTRSTAARGWTVDRRRVVAAHQVRGHRHRTAGGGATSPSTFRSPVGLSGLQPARRTRVR
jgi:two-component system OmpR family sensor kinase